ncbi:hypothetical protein B296_00037409 [Ensete ventricosum]|uniref:RING-type E3 ubiquitin transferase n=1 Tax=Ensete ventricosum TaxID=4639 RepID=A0A426XTD1_ENSVE|nr:hypothetical protein B296_00037409 [Ensete ventricosum]
MSLLRQELQDLKDGENPYAVAAVEVRAAEAQSVAERLRIELDEANSRRASVEAELERTRSESASLESSLPIGLSTSNGDRTAESGSVQGGSPGGPTEEGDRRVQGVARVRDGSRADGEGITGVRVSAGSDPTLGSASGGRD